MVGQAIEQRGRHLRITEHGRPFTEGQVGGDDDRGAFVKAADQMEEQLTAGLGEGQIAQLIEDDEVQPGHVVGEPTLLAAAGLCLEAVHEVDDVVEAAAGAVANEGAGNGDGEMGLSGARAADQDHIALIYHEAGIVAAFIAKGAKLFEDPDQRQPLSGRFARIHREEPVQLILPGADPRHRLMPALVAEIRLIRPQDLADGVPGDVQLPRDLLHRPALHVEGPSDPRNRVHLLQLPLRPLTRSERSDKTSGGSKLGADTPH